MTKKGSCSLNCPLQFASKLSGQCFICRCHHVLVTKVAEPDALVEADVLAVLVALVESDALVVLVALVESDALVALAPR